GGGNPARPCVEWTNALSLRRADHARVPQGLKGIHSAAVLHDLSALHPVDVHAGEDQAFSRGDCSGPRAQVGPLHDTLGDDIRRGPVLAEDADRVIRIRLPQSRQMPHHAAGTQGSGPLPLAEHAALPDE
ncbi:Metallopeptidase family protein, partial [Dysosmobacter welbionis]